MSQSLLISLTSVILLLWAVTLVTLATTFCYYGHHTINTPSQIKHKTPHFTE